MVSNCPWSIRKCVVGEFQTFKKYRKAALELFKTPQSFTLCGVKHNGPVYMTLEKGRQGFQITAFKTENVSSKKIVYYPYLNNRRYLAVLNIVDYLEWFEGDDYLFEKEFVESTLEAAVCGNEQLVFGRNKQKVLEFEIIP